MGKLSTMISRNNENQPDFDFMTATSGNPKEGKQETQKKEKSFTFEELQKKARKLAESPSGLDIAAFQRKYKLDVISVKSLLGE